VTFKDLQKLVQSQPGLVQNQQLLQRLKKINHSEYSTCSDIEKKISLNAEEYDRRPDYDEVLFCSIGID
jgi:hypothetical protein